MGRGPQKQFEREAVLENAMELFWARGYDGTGLAALLEHMGIGRQSLYDTFGDKRALFVEALNHYFRSRMGPVLQLLRAPGSPTENLRKVNRIWIDEVRNEAFRGCLVGKAMAELTDQDEELRRTIAGYVETVTDAFEDLVRRGQECGEFTRRMPAREIAMLMVTLNQGAALLGKLNPDPDAAGMLLNSVLHLVQPEPK